MQLVNRAERSRRFQVPRQEFVDPQPDHLGFAGVQAVGVTSGASTPEELVQGVVERLKGLGASEVETSTTVEENVVFTLPPDLQEWASQAVAP